MTWTDPRTWVTDELVTAALMNTHVRDNLNAVPHLLAYKDADETVVSSTTLQDDDDLVVALEVNQVWYMNVLLVMAYTAAADYKVAFTIPAGAAMVLAGASYNQTASLSMRHWNTSGVSQDLLSVSGGSAIQVQGIVTTVATSGNFQLQWAQQASNAAVNTMKKGSAIFGLQLA